MAPTCTLDGCERPRAAMGYCGAHYMRWRMDNVLEEPIKERNTARLPCSVEGCEEPSKAKGLCQRHYDKQRPKR